MASSSFGAEPSSCAAEPSASRAEENVPCASLASPAATTASVAALGLARETASRLLRQNRPAGVLRARIPSAPTAPAAASSRSTTTLRGLSSDGCPRKAGRFFSRFLSAFADAISRMLVSSRSCSTADASPGRSERVSR